MSDVRLALELLAVEPALGGLIVAGSGGSGASDLYKEARDFVSPNALTEDDEGPAVPAGGVPRPDVPWQDVPWIELPANVSEDRFFGDLDVQKTLAAGMPVWQKGLLESADWGYVWVEELSRIPIWACQGLRSVLGGHGLRIERGGRSIHRRVNARLLAYWNPTEGSDPVGLSDMVAFVLPIEGERDLPTRVAQLRFAWEQERGAKGRGGDRDGDRGGVGYGAGAGDPGGAGILEAPAHGVSGFDSRQLVGSEAWRDVHHLRQARALMGRVEMSNSLLEEVCAAVMASGTLGHRLDVFAMLAAKAHAALQGATRVDKADVEVALRLVLEGRRRVSAMADEAIMTGEHGVHGVTRRAMATDGVRGAVEEAVTRTSTADEYGAGQLSMDELEADESSQGGRGGNGDGREPGGGSRHGAPITPGSGMDDTTATRPAQGKVGHVGPLGRQAGAEVRLSPVPASGRGSVDIQWELLRRGCLRQWVDGRTHPSQYGRRRPARLPPTGPWQHPKRRSWRSSDPVRRDAVRGVFRGELTGVEQGRPQDGSIDWAATIRAALPMQALRGLSEPLYTPSLAAFSAPLLLQKEDFRIRRRRQGQSPLILFLVDASGSMAFHRLSEAKAAAIGLLQGAYRSRARVALIAFQGEKAAVLVPPTRSATAARRALERMPAGGGTPLAAALLAANRLLQQPLLAQASPVLLIVVTDGKANVGLRRGRDLPQGQPEPIRGTALGAVPGLVQRSLGGAAIDIATPRQQAERQANALRRRGVHALVMDTSDPRKGHEGAAWLAHALGGGRAYLGAVT